jgi:hypothetical protein
MQLGFVQDDALSSPLSVRLMQLEDAAQLCKNEPVRSPISFLIVRHVYEALFKPANLFRQFRSCTIDEILRQSPDSVMSDVAYAPIAGERANSTLDLDSLSFRHSLAVGFLGFFRPDPGFYSTFLSDKCDRDGEKRLLIGLLLAEASPECSTALGNFLKNIPPYFRSPKKPNQSLIETPHLSVKATPDSKSRPRQNSSCSQSPRAAAALRVGIATRSASSNGNKILQAIAKYHAGGPDLPSASAA